MIDRGQPTPRPRAYSRALALNVPATAARIEDGMTNRTRLLINDALTAYDAYLVARDRAQLSPAQIIDIARQSVPALAAAARAVIIHPRMPARASLVLWALEHLEHVVDTQEVI